MKMMRKNPVLSDLIIDLRDKGAKVPFWKAVARGLQRPSRKAFKINLNKIENSGFKETILVPGTVLGSGNLTKARKIVALRFSAAARQKIEAAGGAAVLLEDFVKENPKGSKTRIMG